MREIQAATTQQASFDLSELFSRIMQTRSSQTIDQVLSIACLDTKLGPMLVIADDSALYLLEFMDCHGLEREVAFLKTKLKAALVPGRTELINHIESELRIYFDGKKGLFKTPIHLMGSTFQKSVWEELRKIPFAQTRSYLQIAKALNKPTAFRAVAQANGANPLAIIVPCHRVINANGGLGGYAGGLARKKYLLALEKNMMK